LSRGRWNAQINRKKGGITLTLLTTSTGGPRSWGGDVTNLEKKSKMAHPEKALTNINKILPFNHYHHINLEGLRNSESQFTKSGE
jgi:hypothetical protein